MKLLLAFLVCLPLVAQSRYLVAVWDNECKDVPRDTCWRYAFMPQAWTIERVPDHPWAYRLLAAPGTNPGTSADLLDCQPSIAGSAATIKGPCRINLGGEVFSITTDATATLSGASTSGTVRWYWDVSGNLIADKSGAGAILTCNASCRTASTSGPGPRIGLPVAEMPFAANVFTSVRDQRALYGLKIVECGAGTTCVERQGVTTISAP